VWICIEGEDLTYELGTVVSVCGEWMLLWVCMAGMDGVTMGVQPMTSHGLGQ